jgi:hypothetical protein
MPAARRDGSRDRVLIPFNESIIIGSTLAEAKRSFLRDFGPYTIFWIFAKRAPVRFKQKPSQKTAGISGLTAPTLRQIVGRPNPPAGAMFTL